MDVNKTSKWERVLSFGIGVLLFLYFDLRIEQFVWGLWFVLLFHSVVMIIQCFVSSGLVTRGVISGALIPYWAAWRVVLVGLWSVLWRLLLIIIAWSVLMYVCLFLVEYLFPASDVFSTQVSFVSLTFFQAEVAPLWAIVIISTILIDWRLLIAPLLAVSQILETIDLGSKDAVIRTDKSYRGSTVHKLAHKRFSQSIGSLLKFYLIELVKHWSKIMLICSFYIIAKAFSIPDLPILVMVHAMLCLTIDMGK